MVYRVRRAEGEAKAESDVGSAMPLRAARAKSREGEREPSRCMWCSHLGRAARNGWRGERHMVMTGWGGSALRCGLVEDKAEDVGCRKIVEL